MVILALWTTGGGKRPRSFSCFARMWRILEFICREESELKSYCLPNHPLGCSYLKPDQPYRPLGSLRRCWACSNQLPEKLKPPNLLWVFFPISNCPHLHLMQSLPLGQSDLQLLLLVVMSQTILTDKHFTLIRCWDKEHRQLSGCRQKMCFTQASFFTLIKGKEEERAWG